MPANRPSLDAMQALARQLSSPVAALFPAHGGEAGPPTAIDESLPVWRIDPDVSTRDTLNLSELASPTEIWHHQVLVSDVPAAYARSWFTEGTLHLLSVVPSELAGRLGRVLKSLEETERAEDELRLLVAPLYQVTALWNVNATSQLRVLFAPPAAGFPDPLTPLEEEAFLVRLRAAQRFPGRVPIRRANPS
jgi:hypothetical protein